MSVSSFVDVKIVVLFYPVMFHKFLFIDDE